MKERCMIDTSIIVKALLENKAKILEELFKKYESVTIPTVIEEALYKILHIIVASDIKDSRFYAVKNGWKKGKGKEDVKSKHIILLELIKEHWIKLLNLNSLVFEKAIDYMRKYGLLPNDALILATCKTHNIKYLATFDEDFIEPAKKEGIEIISKF